MGKIKTRLLLIGALLGAFVLVFLLSRADKWTSQKENTRLLTLVSREHPLDKEVNPEFALTDDGYMVDVRCAPLLEQMLSDGRAAGREIVVVAAYISPYEQQSLFDEKVQELVGAGMSEEAAQSEAARTVPAPRTSEHELGLAVDLADAGYPTLDGQQVTTDAQRWLSENSWRYGFIQRYPEGKSAVTGEDYTPWHYRFVGEEAAAQIHELNITLEEYIEMFYS